MRGVVAVTLGCVAVLGAASPAFAAAPAVAAAHTLASGGPTITVPVARAGYGPITITGTATPGATVQLYESAYKFRDFYPAPDYDNGGYVTTTATSAGRYTLTRIVDSGFFFHVKVDGVDSAQKPVAMGIVPTLSVRATGSTVTVRVGADPAQPGLRVHVQRLTGGTWGEVATGITSDPAAAFTATLSGQPAASYRAVIDADSDNNLLRGQSPVISIGSAPVVRFTKIQYRAPGGLNAEWARLTNRGGTPVDLKGWKIRDAAGNTYTYGTSHKLAPGASTYLHTGKGANGADRHWNRTSYVWNNGGDTAYLRNPAGATIDTCTWGQGSGVTTC